MKKKPEQDLSLNVSDDNYFDVKAKLKQFLIVEINKYIVRAGSQNKLSLDLGNSEKFVQMILKRNSFSALERLWRECKKIFESEIKK